METNIAQRIDNLIKYWRDQNIDIVPKSFDEIELLEIKNGINLPDDFKLLYSRANGMGAYYPNEIDKEGFLFYPLEEIVAAKHEFDNSILGAEENLYVICNYMHKSWWYGLKVYSPNDYKIGIILHGDEIRYITNSLSHFIELYINDAVELYDV